MIIAAVRVTQAHDFTSALPGSYNIRVRKRGVLLSDSQWQHIIIARAFLQDCLVLVFDEATTFAGPENEAVLVKALATAMHSRTVIMVTYRLSMVTQADVTLLLSDGQLREIGNHTQLLAQGGLYQRLWQHYQRTQYWVSDGTQGEVVESEKR